MNRKKQKTNRDKGILLPFINIMAIIITIAIFSSINQPKTMPIDAEPVIKQKYDNPENDRQTSRGKNSSTEIEEIELKMIEIERTEMEMMEILPLESITPTKAYNQAHEVTHITSEDYQAISLAEKNTGIPSDVLIALYFTESSNGTDVGNISPRNIIPEEEWPIFEQICQEASIDPEKTKVNSCKAMGGFQFQPATWLEISEEFSDEYDILNPWNTEDAAHAAGFFLLKHGYNDDPLTALVIYKGGPKAVGSWIATKQGQQVLDYAAQIRGAGI